MRLALIPARGGSKGLPGKNVRPLDGIPLISWTIRAARASGCFDRVVVSTDDKQIAELSEAAFAEVPYMRPPELSTDQAGSAEIVLHAISALDLAEDDGLSVLQPTSPFRAAEHIQEAVEMFDRGASSVISVSDAKPLSWNFFLDSSGAISPATNEAAATHRQSGGKIVQPNGAIYIMNVGRFGANPDFFQEGSVGYLMDAMSSHDIDTLEDFQIAEAILTTGAVRRA